MPPLSACKDPSKHYIIGNWKMNGTRQEADATTAEIIEGIKQIYDPHLTPILCPPFTLLDRIGHFLSKAECGGKYHFPLGAQNCSYPTDSPRTGSVSAEMLSDLNVAFVILGHSERRLRNRENSQEICLKALAVQKAGLIPIICIGENSKTRQEGKTEAFLQKQIEESVPEDFCGFLSYEPVWAIGQANSAPASEIEKAAKNIKKILKNKNSNIQASVLYGGSVNAHNVASILSLKDINGVLLGRASLHAKSFLEVYKEASSTIRAKNNL